uniref:Uncharacterized protein n=1 Tax=Anopheles culicifacies TaxID=139723 RepID=A0A182MDQ1_9DIPT
MPKAQALMQDNLSADESNLQTIDREESKKRKQEESRKHHKEDSDESGDSEDEDDSSNDGESDESIDMNNRHRVNLPLDLHLTDLASAILRENQKSRMNCIVERRRSEELVDSPPKMVRLPFGMDLTTDPKQQKVTGERIAIFCESGNELKNEDAEPVRQVLIPIPPVRSFGPITHLPQQMGPPAQTIIRQMPRPIFPMQMISPHHQQPQQQSQQQLPPIPAQMMQAPHPDAPMGRPNFHPFLQQLPQIMAAQMHQQSAQQPQPAMPPRTEVRIHLQRIPIPEIMRPFLPPQIIRNQAEQEQQQPSAPQPQAPQQQEVQIREMPIDMAIHKFPMPSSDEMNVADFAAQKFTEQLRSLIARIAESEESDEETDSYRNVPDQEGPSPHSDERELQEQQPPRPTEPEMAHQEEQEQQAHQQSEQQQASQQQQPQQQQPEPQQMLPMGRMHYGRSLLKPISLPGNVMESSASEEDAMSSRDRFKSIVRTGLVRHG